MPNELFTETEVARRIHVSLACLRRWRLERRGPQFIKIGPLVRYRPEELEAWLATLPTGGSAEARKNAPKWKSRLAAGAIFALASVCAFAQQFSSLNGTVVDPSGAVIPNVSVTITSLDRGTSRETKSDGQGRYIFPQVQPGRYKVLAKASGFTDVVVNDVALQINTPGKVNITFEKVGNVAETISVSAEAVQVNTTDASIGNVIGTKPILQLPLFARNLAALLAFQPGVTSFGEVNGKPLDDRSGSVNGGKSDQSNITLDGIDVNNQRSRTAFSSVLRVTLDSTQEFRTITNGAGAEFGRSSGAQVALVTKSGSNDIHGSLYHVHRNTVTAANSFFNNASRVRRPALLINIPGGSVGGAIKKNRTFYFLNYEARRDASQANVSRTVPSMLMRQGTVQYLNTGGQIRELSPADIQSRVDPLRRGVNQASLQLMQSYPAPNDFTLGDGLNIVGFRFSAPVASKEDTYIARFDHHFNANNQVFIRGQLQNDRSLGAPQFPGDQPASADLINAKGIAVGWTSILSSSLVATTRYGITRRSNETTGIQNASAVTFRNLTPRFALTRGLSRQVPLHQFGQDYAWTRGSHDIRFGGVMRRIENASRNYNNSFHQAIANLSWLRGTGSDLQTGVPDLAASNRVAYGDAMMAVLGIVTQGTGRYNYNIDGSLVPLGAPVRRRFRNEEYEMYVSDSWRVKQNLTLTLGLRYSLMPPIYEADGVQLSSDIPLGQWFNSRGVLGGSGRSQQEAGRISYILANGPGGRDIYPFHKKNFAPRASLAWSPSGKGWLSKLTGGPGRTSIRAGWGMFYDVIGQPLTQTYDSNAFGLATSLTNPAGQLTSLTAPRFGGFNSLPGELIRPAARGGFPATPPSSGAGSFAITNSIDDTLKMPYTMNMNFSIGREFKGGLFIEGSYVGRLSRRSLMNRDLAMPTNLTDTQSGQTYFQAASYLAAAVAARTPVAGIQAQPFFERFFRTFAGSGRTATQNIFQDVARFYPNDFTSTLADIDHFCDPVCGVTPNLMFSPQFSALSAWSSVGSGAYHAMQWVVRKRFSSSLTADFNYTWAKSIDLGSRAEDAGTFTGFAVNTWNLRQRRAPSDYDQRQIVNAYAVWELPFGKGKRWGSNFNGFANALLGGWQMSPTWQQSTELPISVGNGRNWPTNWNITGFATPKGVPPVTTKTAQMRGIDGRVTAGMFSNAQAARDAWDFTLPGQSGSRNSVRVDGVFQMNLSVGKRFWMPYSENHTLQFRWETFNITNTNRFDFVNLDLGNVGAFGRYTSSLGSPRQMQFLLRYEF